MSEFRNSANFRTTKVCRFVESWIVQQNLHTCRVAMEIEVTSRSSVAAAAAWICAARLIVLLFFVCVCMRIGSATSSRTSSQTTESWSGTFATERQSESSQYLLCRMRAAAAYTVTFSFSRFHICFVHCSLLTHTQICKQSFMLTASDSMLQQHCDSKHNKKSPAECFPGRLGGAAAGASAAAAAK